MVSDGNNLSDRHIPAILLAAAAASTIIANVATITRATADATSCLATIADSVPF